MDISSMDIISKENENFMNSIDERVTTLFDMITHTTDESTKKQLMNQLDTILNTAERIKPNDSTLYNKYTTNKEQQAILNSIREKGNKRKKILKKIMDSSGRFSAQELKEMANALNATNMYINFRKAYIHNPDLQSVIKNDRVLLNISMDTSRSLLRLHEFEYVNNYVQFADDSYCNSSIVGNNTYDYRYSNKCFFVALFFSNINYWVLNHFISPFTILYTCIDQYKERVDAVGNSFNNNHFTDEIGMEKVADLFKIRIHVSVIGVVGSHSNRYIGTYIYGDSGKIFHIVLKGVHFYNYLG